MDSEEKSSVPRICFCGDRRYGSAVSVAEVRGRPDETDRYRPGSGASYRGRKAVYAGLRRRRAGGAAVGGNYRKLCNENPVRTPEREGRTDPEDRPA